MSICGTIRALFIHGTSVEYLRLTVKLSNSMLLICEMRTKAAFSLCNNGKNLLQS